MLTTLGDILRCTCRVHLHKRKGMVLLISTPTHKVIPCFRVPHPAEVIMRWENSSLHLEFHLCRCQLICQFYLLQAIGSCQCIGNFCFISHMLLCQFGSSTKECTEACMELYESRATHLFFGETGTISCVQWWFSIVYSDQLLKMM